LLNFTATLFEISSKSSGEEVNCEKPGYILQYGEIFCSTFMMYEDEDASFS